MKFCVSLLKYQSETVVADDPFLSCSHIAINFSTSVFHILCFTVPLSVGRTAVMMKINKASSSLNPEKCRAK